MKSTTTGNVYKLTSISLELVPTGVEGPLSGISLYKPVISNLQFAWARDLCGLNFHSISSFFSSNGFGCYSIKTLLTNLQIFRSGEQRDYCGYPGISEQECWSQYQCCYYHNRCYYPKGHSKPKSGLTPGGAAALTFFMFLIFFFLPVSYYLYKKNGLNTTMPKF